MTVLSFQTLNQLRPVFPFLQKTVSHGMTFGASHCGYDVRIAEQVILGPGAFSLASTLEEFDMPSHIMAVVHDKSSWARQGLSVFNTVLEPGWKGYLTLELKNQGDKNLAIFKGAPIAQIVFSHLDAPSNLPYTGKYQNQGPGPQPAIAEKG